MTFVKLGLFVVVLLVISSESIASSQQQDVIAVPNRRSFMIEPSRFVPSPDILKALLKKAKKKMKATRIILDSIPFES